MYLIKYVNSVRSVTKPTRSKRGIQMGFVVVLLHTRKLTKILMFAKSKPNQNPLTEHIYHQ